MAFIYHIATAADWERALRDGQYMMSTRGLTLAEQGFIHASTASQAALVANAFYRDDPDLLLLVIDTDRVGPEIRYEHVPGQDLRYPHIYGPLNVSAVMEARPFEPGPDGQFSFEELRSAERAAEEVELEQEQVLRHRFLGRHVRDAGQRQHRVRVAGRQQRPGQAQRVRHHHVVVRQPVDQHERSGGYGGADSPPCAGGPGGSSPRINREIREDRS